MARQVINLGSSPNKGDGDPLRLAFTKINENFRELYDLAPGDDQFVRDVLSEDSTVLVDSKTGTHYGNFIGDLIGSLFADDSTLIVDGVTGEIPGYVSLSALQDAFAQASDLDDLKTRIANL